MFEGLLLQTPIKACTQFFSFAVLNEVQKG